MANIDIEIAGRRYNVACRDGEEEHLHSVAAEVDRRAHDAATALGSLSETRQLLFAALLIADEMKEVRSGAGLPDPVPPPPDPAVAQALERLAARMESLADSLERSDANA
jgi:cell division protein ZapA